MTFILMTSMSVCRSPFEVGMPHLPEHLGFALTDKNGASQSDNIRGGLGESKVGWVGLILCTHPPDKQPPPFASIPTGTPGYVP